MANPTPSAPPAVNDCGWNEDLIFETLANASRRRILVTLARSGPRAASDLTASSGRRLDATLKHLTELRASGLVVQQENPQDGRKYLYALAANVPVTRTEKGAALDFGFCQVRL